MFVFIDKCRKSGVFRTSLLPLWLRAAPRPLRVVKQPADKRRLFSLNFSCICTEPVLVNQSVCVKAAQKSRFPHRSRPNSFGGIGRRSNPRGVSARTSPGCFSTRSARSASGRHLVSSPAENAPFSAFLRFVPSLSWQRFGF
jgi:hypothetical protein